MIINSGISEVVFNVDYPLGGSDDSILDDNTFRDNFD